MDGDPPGNLIVKIIIMFALILVNAFFAMSEIAIISLNDNKVRKMAEGGHKAAGKVVKLTSDSSSFLSTIQIGVTLAGFLTAASASQNFSAMLSEFIKAGLNNPGAGTMALINGVSVVIITMLTSYFSLVLGELAPKRIAIVKCESISFRVVGILLFVKGFMKPFVAFLSVSTNLILRMFGIDPHAVENNVTEEEIRMLVDVGEEKGVIEESQKEMINNIFEFDDIAAVDVMTHRTDIEAVPRVASVEDIVKISIESGRSRLPVYEENIDDIIGIIYIRDLLPLVGKSISDSPELTDLMREAHFVPESMRCGKLFTEMTEKHIQMVIVSDEYGGTAGIVTIEDLLESIVGSMQDEYDDEDEEIEQLDETTFEIEGITAIEEIEELLSISLPEGEYETLAGMIMSFLERIPKEGEHPTIEVAGYSFTVMEVDDRRIERVLVEKQLTIDN